MALPETNSPPCHALGAGLEPMEMGNLGLNRGSVFQESNPLRVLPERVGSENGGLPPQLPYGGIPQPPLGTEYESTQAAECMRKPVAYGSAGMDAVVEKQPVVGLELGKELEKKPTCFIDNLHRETPPEEVDIGLPQTQEPVEAKNAELQIGLATELPFAQQPEEKAARIDTEPEEPPVCIKPIYCGKYFDRVPCLPCVSSHCHVCLFVVFSGISP